MRRAVVCMLFAALAACGGGSGGGSVTPVTRGAPTPVQTATPTPTPTPTLGPQMGTAQLQLLIPSVGPSSVRRQSTTSSPRKPMYVSLATGSAEIWINGTPVDASTVQTVCNPAVPSGSVCTLSIPAPAGNDTFLIALGDANFNWLSKGSTQAVIDVGQVTVLHLTFLGVPARVTLKLDTPNPQVGQSATLHLTVTAYDADNNEINGDDFFTPVTVTEDDKTGQVSMAGSQFGNPNDSITVSYGGKLIPNVTFSAVIPASSHNVSAVLAPTPYRSFATSYQTWQATRGPDGNNWFTECTGNTGPCKIGRITPAGQLTESADVRWAQALTAGPDGNVWFTEGTFPYVGKISSSMQITEYQTKVLGANEAYYGGPIVVGRDRNLWFMELNDLAELSTAGQILTRIPVSGAEWSPSMVVGADGNFWVAGMGEIVRVTPAGAVSAYAIGSVWGLLQSNLVLAPDSHIYFDFNGFYKIGMDGAITGIATAPDTLRFGGPFTVGPDNNVWGLANTTDQYSTSPVAGAASMAPATNALTVYGGGGGSPGTGQYAAAWDGQNDLWLPSGGGSIVRFKFDL